MVIPRTKSNAAGALVALLSAVVSVATGSLMLASHLPFQINRNSAEHQLASQLGLVKGTWSEVDLLAAGCTCSRRVAEHLSARGTLAGVQQQVLIVGSDKDLEHLFSEHHTSAKQISVERAASLFGTRGAPLLVLIDPAGRVRYAGGYSPDRGPQPDFRDREILAALQADERVPQLPIFGCAIERRLQRQMDPLGLKYGFLGGRG